MKKTVKGILSLMLAFTLIFALLIPAYAAGSTEAETKAGALKRTWAVQGYVRHGD